MKATNIPTLQPVPFATNAASGNKRTIPATQPAGSPGYASYSTGFPPETMQPIAAGGTPPYGQDFNGLFFDVTNELRWAQAGGTYVYNSAFSTSIGGYPAGSVLKSASTNVLWISTVDDNTTDPDSSGASGWIAFRSNSGRTALAVVAGDITPSKVQLGSSLISITGDATGLTSTLRLPLTAGASYLVNNATTGSGATLNVQGSTGTGVTIAQGQAAVVFSDGTNYYTAGSSGAGVYLPINGTAVAATKLATARAFNLAGMITSDSQNFDGTGNVTLTTSIADGALSIAKTSGLQTALNGKLGTGGGALTGALATVGVSFGSALAASSSDLSKHISLYGTTYGFSVTSGTINYVTTNGQHKFWGGASAATLLASIDGNGAFAAASSGSFGGNVTVSGLVNFSTYLQSSTVSAVLATGSAGTVYLRPNGISSAVGQCTIDASGNLTTAGTGNFQGSDIRLKKRIRRSSPRPLHRKLAVCDYEMIDTGKRARGILAQDLLEAGGLDYVGEANLAGTPERPIKRLTVNYGGAATEIAMWAATEVDRINVRAKRDRWAMIALAVAMVVLKVL